MIPLFALVLAMGGACLGVALVAVDYVGCIFEWSFDMPMAARCAEPETSLGQMAGTSSVVGGMIGVAVGLRVLFTGKLPWD